MKSDSPQPETAIRFAEPADFAMVFATPEHRDELPGAVGTIGEAMRCDCSLSVTVGGVVGIAKEYEEGPAMSVLVGRLPGARVTPITTDTVDWQTVRQRPASLPETLGLDADDSATPGV